jgi:hypothetical protein
MLISDVGTPVQKPGKIKMACSYKPRLHSFRTDCGGRSGSIIKQIELANNSVLFTNRLVNDKFDYAIDQFFTLI